MIYVMGNTFGSLFKISTWGESHGGGVGVVIDGCPSLLSLKEDDIQRDLDRRRPGQSKITTQRAESDTAEILSTGDGVAPSQKIKPSPPPLALPPIR